MAYGTIKVDTIENTNGQTGNAIGPGFKNRIINGDMRIDQRNAGASITPTNGQYSVDRFACFLAQASKYSVQQSSTAPAGFTNSILVTSLSAYSSGASEWFGIAQRIEGLNTADLGWGAAGAKTVTLSFWVQSSLTGTFGGSLNNSGFLYNYPFSYTISSANTWEQKTVTITGPTAGTWLTNSSYGIQVHFNLGTGSTYSAAAGSWTSTANILNATGATSVIATNGATWYITGVQLEVGPSATSFDYRPYGTELMLCQRYLPAYLGSALAVQYQGQAYSTTAAYIPIPHPVVTRVAPTGITTSSMSAVITKSDGSGAAITNLAFTQAGVSSTVVNATGASGLTAGNASILIFNSGTLLLTGCEL